MDLTLSQKINKELVIAMMNKLELRKNVLRMLKSELQINEKGGNNKEYKQNAFNIKFVALLKQDKEKVDDLIERWNKVKKDPKLVEFAKQIQEEFFKPKQNISGKLIIFSESKETIEELTLRLSKITKKKVLTVSSENRKYVENTIRNNFDANLEEEKWQNDLPAK